MQVTTRISCQTRVPLTWNTKRQRRANWKLEDEGEEKEEEEEKSRVKGYRFYERRWHPTFIIGAIETVKSEWMRDIKNR